MFTRIAVAVALCIGAGNASAAQKEFTALNAELSKVWKPIIERKPAPADADVWAKVKDKKHLLEKK